MDYDSDEPLSVKVQLEGKSNWKDWSYALHTTLMCINAHDHSNPGWRKPVRGRPLVATPAPENVLTAATGHFPAILQKGTTDSALQKKWDKEDRIGLHLLLMSVKYECTFSLRNATASGQQSLFQAYWTLHKEYGVVHPIDTFLDFRTFNNFTFVETESIRSQMDKLGIIYYRLRAAGINIGSNHLALQYIEALPPSFDNFRGTLLVGTNIADLDHNAIRQRIVDYDGLKGFAAVDAGSRSKGPRGRGRRRH